MRLWKKPHFILRANPSTCPPPLLASLDNAYCILTSTDLCRHLLTYPPKPSAAVRGAAAHPSVYGKPGRKGSATATPPQLPLFARGSTGDSRTPRRELAHAASVRRIWMHFSSSYLNTRQVMRSGHA